METSKSVFFVPTNNTSLRGMLSLARQICGSYEIVFLIDHKCSLDVEFKKIYFATKAPLLDLLFKILYFVPLKSPKIIALRKLVDSWKKGYARNQELVRNKITELNCERIYVYGDRHDGIETATIQACKAMKIPSIILPIAMSAGTKELLHHRKRSFISRRVHLVDEHSPINGYKNQIKRDPNSDLYYSFYSPWVTLARVELDILPENPWVNGANSSEFICATNDNHRTKLLEESVDDIKIIVTGSLEHDDLYSRYVNRDAIRLKYEANFLNRNLPLVVVSLPPLKEHNYFNSQYHWYVQKKIIEVCSKLDANIIFSLHPRMKFDVYKKLSDRANLLISNEPLANYIPVADLFIADHGSSVVQWGVLCEVPMILVDWFNLGYDIHPDIKVLSKLSTVDEFNDYLLKFNFGELAEFRSKFNYENKYRFSPFDGKCVERILEVG